jgi:glycine hydroxymethyltransferase
MPQIAAWMSDSVDAVVKDDEATQQRIAGEIRELMAGFPMPGWAPA